ncbi:MAG: hypothetical protein O9318_04255 [Hylemonella sp.]|uniref:hypothetical protein n=1 Tax=Hylemonella sp. TaxID=2066020 RepID=UPI0022C2BAAB|nr:hypothetical protein [Hylemonella sp.]MCZ8251662.1 hypothetical protein [Hylemonella sp.]
MTNKSPNPKKNPKEELAPKSSSQKAYSIDPAIVVIVIMVFVGSIFFSKTFESVAVQVSCDSISGGYVCNLTSDTKNPTTLNTCWSINRVCENGVLSDVRKCQSIYFQPGKGSVITLANSEFTNDNECKKVSAFSVEEVSLVSSDSQPANTSKP